MDDAILKAAEAIASAERVVAVTGAGVSDESGIPTFRGDHGIWQKYPIEEYATFEAYVHDPDKVWRFWCELGDAVRGCRANPAHEALAALEQLGRMDAIITQNVDNLHQEAGSNHVIEYHGNARKLVCMKCHMRRDIDRENPGQFAPRCRLCNGLMKPDVVMFGEMIPKHALYEAEVRAQRCDVMIVVGTSAQVFPAAQLPFTAKEHGAFIIEANIEETDFSRLITNAFLKGRAGTTLPELVRAVQSRLQNTAS